MRKNWIAPEDFTPRYAKARIESNITSLKLNQASVPVRLELITSTLSQNFEISYGFHHTPFGNVLIATQDRKLCALHFVDSGDPQLAVELVKSSWANADIIQDNSVGLSLRKQIFSVTNSENNQPLTVLVQGTAWQLQVWRSLLKIPFGSLITYKMLAEKIGRPTASRAVANAVGKNAIAYLIPCHRVIRNSGELGGFRWGIDRKRAILAWEANQKMQQFNLRSE